MYIREPTKIVVKDISLKDKVDVIAENGCSYEFVLDYENRKEANELSSLYFSVFFGLLILGLAYMLLNFNTEDDSIPH